MAALTARQSPKAYLKRRLDTFCNPLVYTFADRREPAIDPVEDAGGWMSNGVRQRLALRTTSPAVASAGVHSNQ